MLNFSPENFPSYRIIKNENQKDCYSTKQKNVIRINPKFTNIEKSQLPSNVDKTWRGIIKGGIFFFQPFLL